MPPAPQPNFVHLTGPTSDAGWRNVEEGRAPDNRRFPTLHRYVGHHPQRQVQPGSGHKIFILFTESLEPSKKQWARMSQEIDIPLGYSQNMHKAHPGAYDQLANVTILRGSSAWTEVQPGDCIFARDKDSDGDPMKDVLWISVAIE